MKVVEQSVLRKRVYEMLGRENKSTVVKHFLNEKVGRSTVYGIIKRFESGKAWFNEKKNGKTSKIKPTAGKKTWQVCGK